MIAAPGSSILPSRSRSRRLPPCCFQATIRSSICCACGVGAVAPLSSRLQQRHGVDRAHVLGRRRVHRRGHRGERPLALLGREPVEVLVEQVDPPDRAVVAPLVVGGARSPCAVVWFQLVIVPSAGSMPCGWPALREEAGPLVLAGAEGRQARVDVLVADRQQAGRVHRDVLVVDVERVERLRGQRRRLDERLRAVHLAVGQPAVVEQVERVLAVGGALRARSRPSRRRPSRSRPPGRGRWS